MTLCHVLEHLLSRKFANQFRKAHSSNNTQNDGKKSNMVLNNAGQSTVHSHALEGLLHQI
jgi:hypothetical protein